MLRTRGRAFVVQLIGAAFDLLEVAVKIALIVGSVWLWAYGVRLLARL